MIISFFVLVFISIGLINLLKISSFVEKTLFSFLISAGLIIIWANFLSLINQLNETIHWIVISLCTAALFAVFLRFIVKTKFSEFFVVCNKPIEFFQRINHWYINTKLTEKIILRPLVFTFITVAAINLLMILLSAPFNWDSMTYHLARMAYFLQHNNFSYFEANYWAQVVHPKNATSLITYAYLLGGKNENFTQLVQFLSYLISVLSVYGISKKIGNTTTQSLFASMVSGLLTEWLMQSTTTQNDMIITAFVGIATFFIFSYHHSMNKRDLWLSAIAIGIMLGVKASSLLPILCIALIAVILVFREKLKFKKKVLHLLQYGGMVLLSIIVFALPSGYSENLRIFNHPLGPVSVRETHSFEGQSPGYVLKYGSINVLRYGFEFLSLDGFSGKLADEAQYTLRHYPYRAMQKIGIQIDSSEATRQAFLPDKKPVAQEDKSYWGIFGFTLIWIAVLISLFSAKHTQEAFFLALTSLAFLLLQSFSGPYDPWRGRYFIICAIFAAPLVGSAFSIRKVPSFIYVLLITILGCMSAFSATLFRENIPILTCSGNQCVYHPIHQKDRIKRLTATRSGVYETINEFDQIVPTDATVALMLVHDSYEYPLFGKELTRQLIPINSFYNGTQPIPDNADYLLYTSDLLAEILPTDISIGQNWYIRDLSK